MPDSILVTGGAGFVGSHICLALRHKFPRAIVVALDNLRRRGSEGNVPRLLREGVRFVHGDVRVAADFAALETPPDLLVECSAEPSAQAGYGGSPEYLVETNLLGTFLALEVARKNRADVIFLSTSRVYPFRTLNALPFGETEERFTWNFPGIREDFSLEGPRTPYGASKLAAEILVEEYADAYGFRFVIDRFGLIAGPYQMARSDQGVLALWMGAHDYNRPLSYIGFGGQGKQVRDPLHVDDASDLILDQVEHFADYAGRRFNAGGGQANSLSLREATTLCRKISGTSLEIGSVREDRPGDVRVYISDNTRVSAVRGWRPQRDLTAILTDIHNWLRREAAPPF